MPVFTAKAVREEFHMYAVLFLFSAFEGHLMILRTIAFVAPHCANVYIAHKNNVLFVKEIFKIFNRVFFEESIFLQLFEDHFGKPGHDENKYDRTHKRLFCCERNRLIGYLFADSGKKISINLLAEASNSDVTLLVAVNPV